MYKQRGEGRADQFRDILTGDEPTLGGIDLNSYTTVLNCQSSIKGSKIVVICTALFNR